MCFLQASFLVFFFHMATDVPVGEDQVQHLELARDIARSFNASYRQVFPLPHALMGTSKQKELVKLM